MFTILPYVYSFYVRLKNLSNWHVLDCWAIIPTHYKCTYVILNQGTNNIRKYIAF